MHLNIDVSPIYHKINDSNKRIVVNEGGTRSAKTYSILIYLIIQALNKRGEVYSIVRKTLAELRMSAMRDFFEILTNYDLYNPNNHNKTDNIYILNGNIFEFIGLDKAQKKRGSKRDYLFINEANDTTLEDWVQLSVRTSKRIFIDYNPSDLEHWIYERVIPREDCEFIHSTYKDNPFLEPEIIREIEQLQSDHFYWTVYGLGKRAMVKGVIFPNWKVTNKWQGKEVIYGLDFGFNNPCSLIKVGIIEKDIWVKEIFYRTNMTNADIIAQMKANSVKQVIYADPAEPASIETIYQAGFNIKPAVKGAGSVFAGIMFMKGFKVHIFESPNIEKESRFYKWAEDKAGKSLDEPVKVKDHAVDAIRYAIYTHLYKGGGANWMDVL